MKKLPVKALSMTALAAVASAAVVAPAVSADEHEVSFEVAEIIIEKNGTQVSIPLLDYASALGQDTTLGNFIAGASITNIKLGDKFVSIEDYAAAYGTGQTTPEERYQAVTNVQIEGLTAVQFNEDGEVLLDEDGEVVTAPVDQDDEDAEAVVTNVETEVEGQTVTVTADVENAETATVSINPDEDLSDEAIAEYAESLDLTVEELLATLTQEDVAVEDGAVEATFELLPPGEHTATVTAGEASQSATFTIEAEAVELAVESVSAITSTSTGLTTITAEVMNFEEDDTATITVTPDADLEADDIVVEDVEIDEDGLVDYTFEDRFPNGTHSVVVSVGDVDSEAVEFTISDFELALEEAEATTEMIRTKEDQQLEFTVDGESYTLDFLESQGYDVSFAYSRTGNRYDTETGLVNADGLAHGLEFRYAVTVSDGDNSVTSDQQTVTVYDEEIAVEITDVALDYPQEDLNLDYVTLQDDTSVGFAVLAGENAFGEILDFTDEDADLDFTQAVESITSSTQTIAFWDGSIQTLRTGTATFELDYEHAEAFDLTFEVKEAQEADAIREISSARIQNEGTSNVTLEDQYGELLRSGTLTEVELEVRDADGELADTDNGDTPNFGFTVENLDTSDFDVEAGVNDDTPYGDYSITVSVGDSTVGTFDLTVADTSGDIEAFNLVRSGDELDLTFSAALGESINSTTTFDIQGVIDGVTITDGATVAEALNEILEDGDQGLKLTVGDDDILEDVEFDTLVGNNAATIPNNSDERFNTDIPQITATATSAGTTTIYLVQTEGTFESVLATIDVEVKNDTPVYTADNISIADGDVLEPAGTFANSRDAFVAGDINGLLEFDGEFNDGDVPAEAIASVVATNRIEDDGVVTADLVITFSNAFGGNTIVLPVEYDVTPVAVTGVTISEGDFSIEAGNTQQLTADVEPANAANQDVTWSSDNEDVATVNADGLVTGVSDGTATITVTTDDGSETDTVSATVTETP